MLCFVDMGDSLPDILKGIHKTIKPVLKVVVPRDSNERFKRKWPKNGSYSVI
jgi:hypothetical protein